MTTLVAYAITAAALTVALWALPLWWIRTTAAADTYRAVWTKGRDQHTSDVRDEMQRRRSA